MNELLNLSRIALSYLEGNIVFDLGWTVAAASVALFFIINTQPELKEDKGFYTVIFYCTIAFSWMYMLCFLAVMPAKISNYMEEETALSVKLGRFYVEKCTLLEENIDNGLFSDKTNRLKCGDTVKNIPTDKYNDKVDAFYSMESLGNKSKKVVSSTKDFICINGNLFFKLDGGNVKFKEGEVESLIVNCALKRNEL
jgi:hypothetical protein